MVSLFLLLGCNLSYIVDLFAGLHEPASASARTCLSPGQTIATCQPTYRNIVGRNMLRAFGHRVVMCCDMLGVVGSSLKMVKFDPTTPNTSQHVATRWPNARNMLRPTMLRYVALACCDRLAGAYVLSAR